MLKVLTALGERITFPEGAEPYVNTDNGRLYISIDGVDVAVFAEGGWHMYGRSLPEPEPEVTTGTDEFDDEDDFDDEV